MEKMRMESPDITAQNVEKIAALFPNCITEAKDAKGNLKKAIDFDKLRQMLSNDIAEGPESYEFTWVGKKAAMVEANTPIRKTLRPCPEESKDWDNTQNLYIEGDNLDALKLLQESYLGKVKMIYIDPPYNTGNDFIYQDNFRDSIEVYNEKLGSVDEDGNFLFKNTSSNGRFHSDWCSMMYSRLLLARNLLSEDGAIFISIDDNEQENLKKICDEVFGAENFRNMILARRRVKSLNSQFSDNGLFSLNVGFEYVLVYSKSDKFLMKALYMKKTETSNKGRWDVFWSNADRPTMRYELLGFTPKTGQWRNSKEKADKAVNNYKLYIEQFSNDMSIEEYYIKTGIKDFIRRIPNGVGKNGGVQHWIAPSDFTLRTSSWMDIEVSQIAKEIELPFENPKSRSLISELIKLTEFSPTDIILDFFSGSATTAHAVMKLNADDGGNRRFIMVQLPEACAADTEAAKAGYANICEIGKERIRRAGAKIKEELGLLGDKLDTGFRMLKVADSNMKPVYYEPDKLAQGSLLDLASNIKEDRNGLDLLFGCLLEWGIPLDKDYHSEVIDGFTVHFYQGANYVACFDSNVSETLIEEIASRNPEHILFRDSCFASAPAKMNMFEICKRLMPSKAAEIRRVVTVL